MKAKFYFNTLFAVVAILFCSACGKSLVSGKINPNMEYYQISLDASANDVYYAVRAALEKSDYAVSSEDLKAGTIVTTWRPISSDSHYVKLFDRKDYSVNAAYHQLEVHIVPAGENVQLKIGSRTKSLVAGLKSSGVEEKKLFFYVANVLRNDEPEITNLGVSTR